MTRFKLLHNDSFSDQDYLLNNSTPIDLNISVKSSNESSFGQIHHFFNQIEQHSGG